MKWKKGERERGRENKGLVSGHTSRTFPTTTTTTGIVFDFKDNTARIDTT